MPKTRHLAFRAGRFLRLLLLVPFFLAQFVASGTMAEAGPDGLRMVLCSGDQTVAVILAADGTIHPESESDHSDPSGPCAWSMIVDRAALVAASPDPAAILVPMEQVATPDHLIRVQTVRQIRPQTRAPPRPV